MPHLNFSESLIQYIIYHGADSINLVLEEALAYAFNIEILLELLLKEVNVVLSELFSQSFLLDSRCWLWGLL